MRIAITREVSPSFERCQLTYLSREPISIDLARAQHRQYEGCLAALGCKIHRLPEEPDLPDSVFVEDAAVVLDELAIITRPGAGSRRPETRSIAEALAPYRELAFIEAPGILDGGDMLCTGRTLFIGSSSRTNSEGFEQMRALLSPHGYRINRVPVSGCLHLKSAVTQVASDTLLINPNWIDRRAFAGMEIIEVDPSEPHGANALLTGHTVVYPSACPNTRTRLEARGIPVVSVEVSELAKAEGSVTCCSLIFNAQGGQAATKQRGNRE